MFAFKAYVFSQAHKTHYASAREQKQVAPLQRQQGSAQLKAFQQLAADANVSFTFPQGFKELKAPNNEDVSFDYAMELPGKEFEIWFRVRSLKENWAAYEKTTVSYADRPDNPDSLYIAMGKAQATAFAGDNPILSRSIPANMVARYNGDAGRSYMINLPDEALTKHYRYALLLTLQKDHTGSIMVVCFSNQRGPEFFKNIDKASNCIKFKP